MRNPVYTGKIKYFGKFSQGNQQPIISQDLFNLAQDIHKKKIRKLRLYKDYSLAGLIKCKECDSFMTPCHTNKRKKGKLKRYYYYRCTSTFKKDWHNCAIRQVNANRLENYIFDNLDRISLDKHYLDSLIFRLNSPVAGDRIGLEPSKVCSESPTISSEIVSQTLRRLTKSLVQKRGIEKNLFIKKFIKSIIYSTNSIQVNLFSPPREKEKTGAESAGKIVCNEDMAPRVGLEPTTYWLQLPPSFLKDWTISFPS